MCPLHTEAAGVGGFSGFGGFSLLGALVRGSGFGGRLKTDTCKFNYNTRYEMTAYKSEYV